MKPTEGRRRVVIEEVSPQIDAGRYPAKRILGDNVTITAAIFSDGHDHVAARLLFRHASEKKWQTTRFTPHPNDLWSAQFTVDRLGDWLFTIEAWVDHLDTWIHDLDKRLAAQTPSGLPQPDPQQPTQQVSTPQDIPLALRIGANHLESASLRAEGEDARALISAARRLWSLADANHPLYTSPLTPEILALAEKYPDLTYATRLSTELPLWVDRERARFSSWYELFPRSTSPIPNHHGTFRDLQERIPEIASMGFDILYMPPIHPIGFAFRKGKNNSVTAQPGEVGSPWAIGASTGGHTSILPELGSFADFDALAAAARAHRMELALDIAFQCSPDHPWVTEHPQWFIHRPDGTIQYAENPPKKYQDIYPLNFESSDWRGLWDALAAVFQFWVDRGIHVFRVDNPHTKALPFWEWCIAEIHKSAPEVLFLAEAFTRPHVIYSLAKAGYTQGYTYFAWRTGKLELEQYFEELSTPPVVDFFRPNVWPNTPDILHEQFQVEDPILRRSIFMQRIILATTLSSNYGIYGPAYELCEGRAAHPAPGKTGSEEYLDSEKYQLRSWNRSDPISIAPLITRLNHIRRTNSALQRNDTLRFHSANNDQILAYSKSSPDPSAPNANILLIAINLDPANEQSATLTLNMDDLGLPWDATFEVEDLLTSTRYHWQGPHNYVRLNPSTQPAHIFRILR
jgi:starch synthase (maltosyl-transferring)